ncbi:mediator of RNA polymerase II transcription subunit 15 [Drosophila subpulchrella]|uniref:mediator of RNA polymerase II transcription subunit 15 n=1 Tax=Drosophila subpulchrella TaxID=1486046 RepID=UPI0018A14245|nr:mediator of RNA polymerase II transcription subunit 15 [Drosophila subpulchrella]
MHFFIVSCLLGLATAIPQGYNYQAQQKVQSQGQVGQPHPQFANLAEHSLLQQALQAPKVQQVLSGGEVTAPYSTFPHQNQDSAYQQQPTQLVGNLAYNALPQSYQPQQQQQQHLVSKDIYVHVPPAEEPEDRYPQPNLPPAPARKHYRIVFIKTPTPSATKTALRIKQAPVEEKTIIYVLTKKPDPLDLQAAIEEIAPKQPSKPEVFFIKYKTQEEAAHAQRTIQAQYDQLGGTSQVSDEGVAPVTSVIGVLDHQGTSAVSTGKISGALGNNYLPANLRT